MITISSNFIFNFTNFYAEVSFFTKLLTLSILFFNSSKSSSNSSSSSSRSSSSSSSSSSS